MSVRVFFVFVVCLCAVPFSAMSQPTFYAVGQERVVAFDGGTGDIEVDVTLEFPIETTMGVAFTPAGNLLAYEDLDHRLLSIDVETGAVEVLGIFDVSDGLPLDEVWGRGLTVDACGRIFLTTLWIEDIDEPYRLWQLDPESGIAHKLGELEGNISALAAFGEEIVTYTAADVLGDLDVFEVLRIDPTTMETESLPLDCPLCSFGGLDLDENGLLWMIPPPPPIMSPPVRPLVSVDIATGDLVEHRLAIGGNFAIAPAGGTCLSGAPLVIPTVSPLGLVGLVGLLMLAGVWVSLRRRQEGVS